MKYKILIDELQKIVVEIKKQVEERCQEFRYLGEKRNSEELFSELSFCTLTANYSAKGGIKVQNYIGKEGFCYLSKEELTKKLKDIGYRFPNKRAEYIVNNRFMLNEFDAFFKIETLNLKRKFLVKNVKGIGWKESSHFLRNIGYFDLAILDKHILRVMYKYNLIKEIPKKAWNESRYLEIEKIFKDFSLFLNEKPGVLDLYIWYAVKKSVDK